MYMAIKCEYLLQKITFTLCKINADQSWIQMRGAAIVQILSGQ